MITKGEFIAEFGSPKDNNNVNSTDADNYRGRVPDELIEYWIKHGTGYYADRNYWTCLPQVFDEYFRVLLAKSNIIRADEFAAIGYSCMGSVDLWHRSGRHFTYDLATASLIDWTSMNRTAAIPYDIEDLANMADVTIEQATNAFLEGRKSPESVWNILYSMASDNFYQNIFDEEYSLLIPQLESKYGKLRSGEIFLRNREIFLNTPNAYVKITIDKATKQVPEEIIYTKYIETQAGQSVIAERIHTN